MLKFILQKIMNKKWMIACLLIGNVLLIGIVACNPMYKRAALNKMICNTMEDSQTSTYPALIKFSFTKLSMGENKIQSNYFNTAEGVQEDIEDLYGVPCKNVVNVNSSDLYKAISSMAVEGEKSNDFVSISNMDDIENHINVIAGEMYSADDPKTIECIISQKLMVKNGYVLGQDITLKGLKNEDTGEDVKLKIVGVFDKKEENDEYWVASPASYVKECFVADDVFEKIMNSTKSPLSRATYLLLDYSKFNYDKLDEYAELNTDIESSHRKNSTIEITTNFTDTVSALSGDVLKVKATMWMLQVPVLFLTIVFIYMVSKQMLEMEQNEISMMKSRGVSKMQIINVYLIQSALISGVSFIIGIPFGYFICRILGASNSFMEFVNRKPLDVKISGEVLLYALVAALCSIVFMTVPVIRYSKVTIVEHKQKKRGKKKPLWRIMFLDLILIAVSLYGLYSFSRSKDDIANKVTEGSGVDPLLFLSSSLFILGVAMFAIRVMPYIVSLVYCIGKKKWSVAMYTSFLQTIRTFDKQSFIVIFLILTVAFGIFNATTARTINLNEEDGINYNNGADLVMQEKWQDNSFAVLQAKNAGIDMELEYTEPDYYKYQELSEDIEQYTKVYNDSNAGMSRVKGSEQKYSPVQLMGINTKEFGETAWLRDGVLDKHWYNYLNALAQEPEGVLVSSNMKDLGIQEGDSIRYSRLDGEGKELKTGVGVVIGFVDVWPSYNNKTTDNEGNVVDNYLIVANYDQLLSNLGLYPYEIWMNVKKSTSSVYTFAEENKITYEKFNDSTKSIVEHKNNPIFQSTNGMLTISFIVILILCATGFLIYWILSIKSRELMFGIYRAMGMTMREIITMLVNEHVWSSILSIILGTVIGIVASNLYVPLIELAYSASNVTLPILITTKTIDMVRLGVVIGGMLIACIIILGRILSKLKISQALKLGEE